MCMHVGYSTSITFCASHSNFITCCGPIRRRRQHFSAIFPFPAETVWRTQLRTNKILTEFESWCGHTLLLLNCVTSWSRDLVTLSFDLLTSKSCPILRVTCSNTPTVLSDHYDLLLSVLESRQPHTYLSRRPISLTSNTTRSLATDAWAIMYYYYKLNCVWDS